MKRKMKNVISMHAKYDTACTIDKRFERPWQLLKGIPIKNVYVPEFSYPTTKKYINLKGLPNKKRACGVNGTACTFFELENRSYLGEFEAEFKKALDRETGAQGVLFDEKKPKVENLVTLSLWHILIGKIIKSMILTLFSIFSYLAIQDCSA
jgi:hypothetical protein